MKRWYTFEEGTCGAFVVSEGGGGKKHRAFLQYDFRTYARQTTSSRWTFPCVAEIDGEEVAGTFIPVKEFWVIAEDEADEDGVVGSAERYARAEIVLPTKDEAEDEAWEDVDDE